MSWARVIPCGLCHREFDSKNIFVNPDEFINRIDALLVEKKIQQNDTLVLVDGRIFERDYVPVFSKFEYLGNMWTYRDITDKQKLEQKVRDQTSSLVKHTAELEKSQEASLNILEDLEVERDLLAQTKVKDEAIFASMGDGLAVADETGRLLFFNKKAEEIFGVGITSGDPSAWQKEYGVFDPITLKTLPADQQPILLAIKGEAVNKVELFIRNPFVPEGRFISVTATPIVSNGKVMGSVAIFRDMTKEKEVDKAKTDIISLASHQLKTPLAELKGYVENMLDGYVGNFSETQISYLQDMKNIVGDGYKLVSDLLDMSSLERGVFSININPLNLSEMVKDLANEYKKPIEDKGLTFSLVTISEEMEILADADKLREALRNIINNAIKFTSQGSIMLEQKKDDKFAILVIRDTGTGISPENIKMLFKKEKVFSGKAVAGAGAGLGLYIAKRFIELQNGTIECSSKVGEGTEFTIKIPMRL